MKPQFQGAVSRAGLANPAPSYFEINANQIWQDSGFVAGPFNGEQPYSARYNIRGDWLHVAPDSTFVCRADFFGNAPDDVQTVMLTPGTTIRFPFNGVRFYSAIFNNQALLTAPIYGVTGAGIKGAPPVPYPVCRLFYGIGEPAIMSGAPRGAINLPRVSQTLGVGASNAQFTANEGTRIRVDAMIQQTTLAAENSWLRGQVQLQGPAGSGTFAQLAPEQAFYNDAGASSVAYYNAFWRFTMPRGLAYFTVIVSNVAPAALATTAMASFTGSNFPFSCMVEP